MSKHKTRQIARITGATMQLIAEVGLSRLSIAGIADQAGITRQTIYNYFDDVEGIIASALSEHTQAFAHILITAMNAVDDPYKKIRALAETQISMASADHESIDLEAALSAEQRAELSAHMRPVKSALKQAIVAGKRSGIHSGVACDLVWEMTEAAMRTAAAHPSQKTDILEALTKATNAILMN